VIGKVIELGLAVPQSGHSQVEGLRSIIDRSFVLLGDWLTAFGDGNHDNLCGGLDACRTALADGMPVEELEALVGPCLHAGRSIVTQIQLQQVESRNEMSTLITIVREAVEAVATETKDLHVSLKQSTERFAAVAELNNIHQIRTQIVAEVSVLRRVIAERQRSWDSSAALLNERVGVLERQLQTSRQEASVDPLTHIANRRAFDQALGQRMSPGQLGFVLAFLDIDGFKTINDQQGHAQGDRSLVALAQTLKGAVRPDDLVARLGGDEFSLLMTGITLRQAEFRLKTIISALAGTHFPGANDSSFTLTVSAGVSEFSAGDTAASLMHRADEALYQAKHLGKNRVVAKASALLADLLQGRSARPDPGHDRVRG
jgi:diguanylate cyclase (GGDEF)-like protein